MNELTLALLKAVISAAVVVFTYYVRPILKAKYEALVDEKTRKIVKEAVEAFEQSIKGSGKGELKKEKVTTYVIEALARGGIRISAEDLNVLIEAAVGAMNAKKDATSVVNITA